MEYDDRIEAEKDEVVRQNPMQGSEVPSDYEITVICSKGTQKEKKVNIEVDLPSEVATSVSMKVLVDGAVDNDNSKDVVPSYSPKYKITVKVKDDATIVVLLDDQQYREYKVDYANNSVSLANSYPYTPKSTDAPATQAPAVEEPEETPSNQEEVGGLTTG